MKVILAFLLCMLALIPLNYFFNDRYAMGDSERVQIADGDFISRLCNRKPDKNCEEVYWNHDTKKLIQLCTTLTRTCTEINP